MALRKITVMGYACERCQHEWVPKSPKEEDKPRVCPKCKSPYWDRPRRSTLAKKKSKATSPKS